MASEVKTPRDECEKLQGSVESVIYTNEENGYAILDFGTSENELVTIVGTLPYVSEGDELTVFGKWVHNKKYGRQFAVQSFEKRLPTDSAAILRYLSSGVIKGLGAKRAQRIVDLFGEDSFDVIENHPDWLTEISGINRRLADEISGEFRRQAGARDAMNKRAVPVYTERISRQKIDREPIAAGVYLLYGKLLGRSVCSFNYL